MRTVHAAEHGGRQGEPGHDGDDAADVALAGDLAELRAVLADHPFPTHQDDLIAACLVANQPARLCCRLSRLSRTHTYTSLDEVCADVASAALAGSPERDR